MTPWGDARLYRIAWLLVLVVVAVSVWAGVTR